MARNSINASEVKQILDDITSEIVKNKDYLTELDSVAGDGDHGVNLERGFLKVRSQLQSLTSDDIGTILTSVGTTILSTVGGATGSLYGAAFMKAGSVCRGKSEIESKDLPEILTAFLGAMKDLGGANAGDKTMLDVMIPVTETVVEASKNSDDLIYIFEKSAKAAKEGLESTKSMTAKKGRASYLGDRTLGHYDVGAASLCMMIETCAKTISKV